MHVLHARGGIGSLMYYVGGSESVRSATNLAVDIDIDITVCR